VIFCSAAPLVAASVQPATPDDAGVCQWTMGDNAMPRAVASTRKIRKMSVPTPTAGSHMPAGGEYDRAMSDFDRAIQLARRLLAIRYPQPRRFSTVCRTH